MTDLRVHSTMARMPKPSDVERADYEKLAEELHSKLCSLTTPETLKQWNRLLKKNDAALYRQKFSGNPVECFRMETKIDRSPDDVMDLIWDMTAQNEGVEIFDHAYVIQKVNDTIQIEVSYTKPVLVVDGRESITIRSYRVEPDGSLTMAGKTVDPPKGHITPPEFVKSNVYLTGYRLYPIEDGKATHCVNILWTDPMGHIPKLLVNTQGRQIALQRFINIRRLAMKRPVGFRLHPVVPAEAESSPKESAEKLAVPLVDH